MAKTPFGHAVTIQNSSAATIVIKMRSTAVAGEIISGNSASKAVAGGVLRLRFVKSASPLSAAEIPIRASAVLSPAIRNEGASAGALTIALTAAPQRSRK